MWKVIIEDTSGHYVATIGQPANPQTAQKVAADLNAFFADMELHFCAKYKPGA